MDFSQLPEPLWFPVFGGTILFCVIGFFALFGRNDLRDGHIDTVVTFTFMSILSGLCITMNTGHVIFAVVGFIGPGVLFSIMRIIYKKIQRQK